MTKLEREMIAAAFGITEREVPALIRKLQADGEKMRADGEKRANRERAYGLAWEREVSRREIGGGREMTEYEKEALAEEMSEMSESQIYAIAYPDETPAAGMPTAREMREAERAGFY